MKHSQKNALSCTKAPKVTNVAEKSSSEDGDKSYPSKANKATKVKGTPRKRKPNTSMLHGDRKTQTDKSAEQRSPENEMNVNSAPPQFESGRTGNDEEITSDYKEINSKYFPSSDTARNKRMQLALLYIERMPHVKGTNGCRMVPWSDVKEILLPSCSDPDCDIVLNALKIVCGYSCAHEVIHACSQKEHIGFLRSFRLVTSGTLLVDVHAVKDKLEHIWDLVRLKHTASEDRNSLRCHYTKAQVSPRKLHAKKVIPKGVFKRKCNRDISENIEAPADKYSNDAEDVNVDDGDDDDDDDEVCDKYSYHTWETETVTQDIRTLKITRKFLPPKVETETMKITNLTNLPKQTKEDILGIESKNKSLESVDENCKVQHTLVKKETKIPILMADRDEKSSIHESYTVASLAAKSFPKVKRYLLEKCRELIVGPPSSSRVKTRCCTASEARNFTAWILRYQGFAQPWQHVTSRDILIDCNSLVEQLSYQPNSETSTDLDTDVLDEIQIPKIKDMPELISLKEGCHSTFDRLSGKETDTDWYNNYLLLTMSGLEALSKHVREANSKDGNEINTRTKICFVKPTQTFNADGLNLKTLLKGEKQKSLINNCIYQSLTKRTFIEPESQKFFANERPSKSNRYILPKPLEMQNRGHNLCGLKIEGRGSGLDTETKTFGAQTKVTKEILAPKSSSNSKSPSPSSELILNPTILMKSENGGKEKFSQVEYAPCKNLRVSKYILHELQGAKKRTAVSYNEDSKAIEYKVLEPDEFKKFYLGVVNSHEGYVDKPLRMVCTDVSPTLNSQVYSKERQRIKIHETGSEMKVKKCLSCKEAESAKKDKASIVKFVDALTMFEKNTSTVKKDDTLSVKLEDALIGDEVEKIKDMTQAYSNRLTSELEEDADCDEKHQGTEIAALHVADNTITTKSNLEGKATNKVLKQKPKYNCVQCSDSTRTEIPPTLSQSESCLQSKNVLKEHNSEVKKSYSAPKLCSSSYRVSVNNLLLTFYREDVENEETGEQGTSKYNSKKDSTKSRRKKKKSKENETYKTDENSSTKIPEKRQTLQAVTNVDYKAYNNEKYVQNVVQTSVNEAAIGDDAFQKSEEVSDNVGPLDFWYLAGYDPFIDVTEEVVDSEKQDVLDIDSMNDEAEGNKINDIDEIIRKENKTKLRRSDLEENIAHNKYGIVVRNKNVTSPIDLEGSVYLDIQHSKDSKSANNIRTTAQNARSRKAHKERKACLIDEDEDVKCLTHRTGNVSRKGKKSKTPKRKEIETGSENMSRKDIKESETQFKSMVQEQQRMLDILQQPRPPCTKINNQGPASTIDVSPRGEEKGEVDNYTSSETSTRKAEPVNKFAQMFNSDGMSEGGLFEIEAVIFPYVMVNGFKFAAVSDIVKIFANCPKKCAIPKMVLTKHKELIRTFATWEQVFTISTMFHQKGKYLLTGDILLRLDILMEKLPDIKSKIRELHRNTKLRRSQNCRYEFD